MYVCMYVCSYQDCVSGLWKNYPIFTLIYSRRTREEAEHTGRFLSVTDSDVDNLIEGEENRNTKRETHYDLNLVNKFVVDEYNESREIEQIPPTELNTNLSQFVLTART